MSDVLSKPANLTSAKENPKEHWENLWESLDLENEIKTNDFNDMQEVFSLYRNYLPQKGEGKIIEAGCGLGAKLLYWHNLGYDITGIDYVSQSLQKLVKYESSVKVVAADIHYIPCPDSFFKVYLSYGVLEHIKTGYFDALMEAYRVLEPNGILVFMVPHDNWMTNFNINPNNFIRRLKKKKIIRKNIVYNNNTFCWRQLFLVVHPPVAKRKNSWMKIKN